MGDLSTPGRYVMKNCSDDYSVLIGALESSNVLVPFDSLSPGEPSSGRLATTAPYARAVGGNVYLEYFISED